MDRAILTILACVSAGRRSRWWRQSSDGGLDHAITALLLDTSSKALGMDMAFTSVLDHPSGRPGYFMKWRNIQEARKQMIKKKRFLLKELMVDLD
ncbi:hypothetical protein ACLOJK_032330 [Asimina triloba]